MTATKLEVFARYERKENWKYDARNVNKHEESWSSLTKKKQKKRTKARKNSEFVICNQIAKSHFTFCRYSLKFILAALNRTKSASALKERWSISYPQMGFSLVWQCERLFISAMWAHQKTRYFYSKYYSRSSFIVKLRMNITISVQAPLQSTTFKLSQMTF